MEGLEYSSDLDPGIRRRRCGRGFTYISPDGKRVVDEGTLERIKRLAIPPAWNDVWISPTEAGHIQATGRDGMGRKQYRYHPRYRAVRDETKFHRMLLFSRLLPKLRISIEKDLSLPGLPREKVLATVVRLLEKTLIRVGNAVYARKHHTYGLTTMRDKHVEVAGQEIRFRFKGKSGIEHNVAITDARLAKIVQQCQSLPGQELFQFIDDEGNRHDITSGDVNEYLKEKAGESVTAKDFRTWAGTMRAAMAFRRLGPAENDKVARKNIALVVDEVAQNLGNTRDVCRKYYIHPQIIDRYLSGRVIPDTKKPVEKKRRRKSATLRQAEEAVLRFLDLEN